MHQAEVRDRLLESLGEENYNRVIQYAFDYAYLESRYLGIPHVGKEFCNMCRFRRCFIERDLLELVDDYNSDPNQTYDITIVLPHSDEEIMEVIRRTYER